MTVVFMSDAGLVSPARPESLLEQRRQFLWCDGDKLSTTQNGDQHEIGTLVVSGKVDLDATDVIDLAARNLQEILPGQRPLHRLHNRHKQLADDVAFQRGIVQIPTQRPARKAYIISTSTNIGAVEDMTMR